MFCKNCGKELSETAVFCDSCGVKAVENNLVKNASLWQLYLSCFQNYAKFNGRARRREYWGFVLFNWIAVFSVGLIGGLIGGVIAGFMAGNATDGAELGAKLGSKIGGNLSNLYALFALVPGLAVCVRRLHDTGRSAWNILWIFTIIGVIPFFIWLCCNGQNGENKYGANPKENNFN
ncbi:MAG: DUF805 domain-containing protein [Chitinivibrionia bacterium]|nr:DUF805 domain-containing protein [Chitinivibrionia bacterium]